jgi:biopolymer transport protein TolR
MFGRLERSQGTEPMSAINVTPLVDVMLVLVVIFILTAPLLVSSVKLELPKTNAASTTDATPSVSLVVDRAGQAYLDSRAVPLAELGQSLARTAARQPDTEVQLSADENAPYGKVIEVLGVAQKAGLTRIGFVTNAPAAPAASAKAASP